MGHCIEGKQILEFLVVLSAVCTCNDSVMKCQNSKYTASLPNHTGFKRAIIMFS